MRSGGASELLVALQLERKNISQALMLLCSSICTVFNAGMF